MEKKEFKEREILRKKILSINGGVKEIANRVGKTPGWVSQVLYSKKNSDKVIDEAIAFVTEIKKVKEAEKAERSRKIKEAVS